MDERYKAYNLTATEIEQELDLGDTYNAFAISNGTGGIVEIKLNAISNDAVVIEKQGSFSYDNFFHNKFYVKTQGGTSKITIFSSK